MAGRRVGRLGCALKYQTENKRHVPTEASPGPAEDEATAGSSSQELREGQIVLSEGEQRPLLIPEPESSAMGPRSALRCKEVPGAG